MMWDFPIIFDPPITQGTKSKSQEVKMSFSSAESGFVFQHKTGLEKLREKRR